MSTNDPEKTLNNNPDTPDANPDAPQRKSLAEIAKEHAVTEREAEFALARLPNASRPTLCTTENTNIILQAISDGLSIDDAAALAGVSNNTIYNWQRYGRNAQAKLDSNEPLTYNDKLYLKFFHDITKAKIEKKRGALKKIEAAAKVPKHWHAAAWFLERVYPGEFARVNRLEIKDWRKEAKEAKVDPDMLLRELAIMLESKIIENAEDADFIEAE